MRKRMKRVGKVEIENHYAVGIEARGLAGQVNHAFDEEARTDEQNHSQGNLRDDQTIPSTRSTFALRSGSSSFLQRKKKVEVRCMPGRRHAEEHAGQHRNSKREREHAKVDSGLSQPRNL